MGHKVGNLLAKCKDWRPHCNPLRPLCIHLGLCHPPGRYCHLLVMRPDPRSLFGLLDSPGTGHELKSCETTV